MPLPVLFENKTECCGCGACRNICPKGAIRMVEDSCGYIYPEITPELCIECGRCKQVCAFQNKKETQTPKKVYAAVAKNQDLQRTSASGGIFAVLAQAVLEKGGVVCGAAFTEGWKVEHILIERVKDLYKLQGSKYTHSHTEMSYQKTKAFLKEGRPVLYSGTPCQIAGLYAYLNKEYENLMTVDIICHGVPSNRMFIDYVNMLEKKEKSRMTAFSFRDKRMGWGINGSAAFENGRIRKIWQSSSSYFYYFVKGMLYRENCYQCPYASKHRPADITLGDYWGIEKAHPDYLGKGGFDESKGISVAIANNEKGAALLKEYGEGIECKDSEFEAAARHNGQLNHPCDKGNRDDIVMLYRDKGWGAVESRFNSKIGWRRYTSQIKALLPASIKRILKGLK